MESTRRNIRRYTVLALIALSIALAPLTAKASTNPEPPPPRSNFVHLTWLQKLEVALFGHLLF